jgi:hypothetical protein
MDIYEWLQYGIDNKFCTDSACQTHDYVELTEEEEEALNDGDDPCIVVVRLWV